jgi:hypothetical protein
MVGREQEKVTRLDKLLLNSALYHMLPFVKSWSSAHIMLLNKGQCRPCRAVIAQSKSCPILPSKSNVLYKRSHEGIERNPPNEHNPILACSNKSRTAPTHRTIGLVMRRYVPSPTPQKVAHHPLATHQLSILVVRAPFFYFRQCRITTFVISRIPRRFRSSGRSDTQSSWLPANFIWLLHPEIFNIEWRFPSGMSISSGLDNLERLRSDSLVMFRPNRTQFARLI